MVLGLFLPKVRSSFTMLFNQLRGPWRTSKFFEKFGFFLLFLWNSRDMTPGKRKCMHCLLRLCLPLQPTVETFTCGSFGQYEVWCFSLKAFLFTWNISEKKADKSESMSSNFYRTRSLAMLVSNWLPNWLTHSLPFSQLESDHCLPLSLTHWLTFLS